MHGDPNRNSILALGGSGALEKEHISLKTLDGSSSAGGEHMSLIILSLKYHRPLQAQLYRCTENYEKSL